MAKKRKAAAAVADTGVSSPQDNGEGGGEKEGTFLLGQPTWEDVGGGWWRCAETGHELPEREKDSYARSCACRLALIDHAVARKNPPLNAFKPHPEHKSKLICSITGNSDDPDFWVPPVGSRWDDDDGKDRWESSPDKDEGADNEGVPDDDDDDNTADKGDDDSRELASRTKPLSVSTVGSGG